MADIHPTAVVDPRAELGVGVRVGPFAVIGAHVSLGDHAIIHPHVVIDGRVELGAHVEVFPQAVVGMTPQDLKFDGRATRLIVGARTVIREAATLHPGIWGETVVGTDSLVMAYCHVAHDCQIGDRVVMANATQVAGHCIVEDGAVLGGATTIHQYCRIGTRAITGASARVQQDVPPYCVADGNPARLRGLNFVGLRRDGLSRTSVSALKMAYRALFRQQRYAEALAELSANPPTEEVARLCSFLTSSERGIARPRSASR